MGSGNKAAYAEFCEQAAVPDYNRPWWLDADCGPGQWDVALAADKKGQLVAALPYCRHRLKGLVPALLQPQLTPYMGIWRHAEYRSGSSADRFTFDRKYLPELLRQLPPHRLMIQKLHPDTDNWMPLLWAGFQQQLRYHFIVHDLSDSDALYRRFNRSVKYSITHGPEHLDIEESNDVVPLYELARYTFERQGLMPPLSLSALQRMNSAIGQHGQHELLYARARDGSYHSGTLLFHTAGVSYPLLAGNGPGSRKTGAFQYLMWECMKRSAAYSRQFNFLGSTMPNIAPTLNGFRAVPTPYFEVYRAWPGKLTPFVQWLI